MTTKHLFSHSLEPTSPKWRAVLPPRALRGKNSCVFQILVAPVIPWLVGASLQSLTLSPHGFSSSLCPSSVCLLCVPWWWAFLKDTCHWVRAHLVNPGWSHLEIPKLITSVKIVFPNKVAFIGFWGYLFGGRPPFNPTIPAYSENMGKAKNFYSHYI